jgi:hypothetical protein
MERATLVYEIRDDTNGELRVCFKCFGSVTWVSNLSTTQVTSVRVGEWSIGHVGV